MSRNRTVGQTNLICSASLFLFGVLFYLMFPAGDIGMNSTRLVESPGWIPVNTLFMAVGLAGIVGTAGLCLAIANNTPRMAFPACILVIGAEKEPN